MADRLLIRLVDPRRGVIDAELTPHKGGPHRIGYLTGEGWFCATCGHSRCPHIATVRDLVPPMEQP
jgi:hypothetical protein